MVKDNITRPGSSFRPIMATQPLYRQVQSSGTTGVCPLMAAADAELYARLHSSAYPNRRVTWVMQIYFTSELFFWVHSRSYDGRWRLTTFTPTLKVSSAFVSVSLSIQVRFGFGQCLIWVRFTSVSDGAWLWFGSVTNTLAFAFCKWLSHTNYHNAFSNNTNESSIPATLAWLFRPLHLRPRNIA